VTVPRLLGDQGKEAVIAPLRTRARAPWTKLGDLTLILYPYVTGRSALEVPLSERHWLELGAALKQLHATGPVASVPCESYSGVW
jgi:hypothetical protein